jgi:hypothetical protein
MGIVLFGCNNPTGAAFVDMCSNHSLETWGRKPLINTKALHIFCDLSKIAPESINPIRGVLVSFAPIWLLAPFLSDLVRNHPNATKNLKGIVACSSSSFMTKRFAFNHQDKELSQKLEFSHRLIRDISIELVIPFQILAPTMIYGKVKGYCDQNLSKLIRLMQISPFIFLPKSSGLRQPIHAIQLARVAYKQADKMLSGSWSSEEAPILTLGGDSILSYEEMLIQIKKEMKVNDIVSHCLIFTIPERLFFLLIALLLPINPKLFEAILRINSDLSHFTMVHQILGEPPQRFPVHPLAIKS